MNYAAIYARFVDSRRQQEIGPDCYFEMHHIVPRCIGGNDEPNNLIRLTPEDHYFAHLLLARMHGGRLWHAVFFMGSKATTWAEAVRQRPAYGIARREFSAIQREKRTVITNDFDRWMVQHGLSVRRAAKLLGVSASTVQDWRMGINRRSGEAVKPQPMLGLACAAITANLPPWRS